MSPLEERTSHGVAQTQAEEERSRFFALSPDLLCIAGFDGYFKHLNAIWQHTLGYTNEELLSQPYMAFVHPDDQESTLAEARKLLDGHAIRSFENRYRCKDGSYRWLVWNAIPFTDQHLIYATASDITQQKRNVEQDKEKLILELQEALANVKTLSGLLPICATCKNVRDDKGYWRRIEDYISAHSDTEFSHGICTECARKLHPDWDQS